jgi:hypothetical protein
MEKVEEEVVDAITKSREIFLRVVSIFRKFKQEKDRVIAFSRLLELLVEPGKGTNQLETPLLRCLPGETTVNFLRRLCLLISNPSSRFSRNEKRLRIARDGVVVIIDVSCLEQQKSKYVLWTAE